LNELLDVYIVVGATMIFMGIGVVNLRYFQRLNTVFLRRPAISGG
jgi:hypothetical protein